MARHEVARDTLEGITLTTTEEHILRTPGTIEEALLRTILTFEAIHGPETQAASIRLEKKEAVLQERLSAYGQDFGPDAIIAALSQGQPIDRSAREQAEQNLAAQVIDAELARRESQEVTTVAQRYERWREIISELFIEYEFHGTPIPPEILEKLETAKRQPTSDEQLLAEFMTLANYVLQQPTEPVLDLTIASTRPALSRTDEIIYSKRETFQPPITRLEPLPVQQRLVFQNWAEVFGDSELNASNAFVINYITALTAVRNRLPDFDTAIQEILDSTNIPQPHQRQYRNMAAIEALVVVTPQDLKDIFHTPKSINPMSRILALVYRKTFPSGPFASVDNFTQLAIQIQQGNFTQSESLEDIVLTYVSSLEEIVYHQVSSSASPESAELTKEETTKSDFPTFIPNRADGRYQPVLAQLATWSRKTLSEKLRRNYQNRPFPNGCADGQLDLILKITKHVRDIRYGDVLRKVCPEGTQGRWTETEALLLLVLHEGRQKRTSGFDRKTVTLLDDFKELLQRDSEER